MATVVTSENRDEFVNSKLDKQNPFDFNKYATFVADNKDLQPDYQPLNFDELLKQGAVRVTHQGLGLNKYNPDPKAGFSLVSGWNDSGNITPTWKDNPSAYDVVKKMFAETPQNIGAHKYLQIVESAKDMGIPLEKIFITK